jgi:DNA-binding PadR family transcriptional regulator
MQNEKQTVNEEVAAKWLKETRKGYLHIAVLTILSRKPHHGYETMKEIKERTRGFWKPTAGGIYPILQSLEESGYIHGEWESGKLPKRKAVRYQPKEEIIREISPPSQCSKC